MFRPVLRWLGRRYQSRLGVETPYFDEVVEHAPGALLPIVGFMPSVSYGRCLPPTVLHMVRLGATMASDCGTCLEIAVNLAVRDGVSPEAVAMAVHGPRENLDSDARLGLQFGKRLGGALDVPAERAALLDRFGPRGPIEASIAVAGALTFPAVQRGMGFSRSCDT